MEHRLTCPITIAGVGSVCGEDVYVGGKDMSLSASTVEVTDTGFDGRVSVPGMTTRSYSKKMVDLACMAPWIWGNRWGNRVIARSNIFKLISEQNSGRNVFICFRRDKSDSISPLSLQRTSST